MNKYKRLTPRGGSDPTPERGVHNENRQRSPWDVLHDATHAVEHARNLMRVPENRPDISMTFSTRFYCFVLLVLVIVWKVLSAG